MGIGIGDTLRDARRQQGRTLGEAAVDTRVRESYLAALEEEDFDALGGDVYVKGFLRSYARFLGLDPNPLIDAYRQHHEHAPVDAVAVAHAPVAASPRERQPGFGIVATVGALLLIVVAAVALRDSGAAEPEVPPPAPQATTPPVSEPSDDPTDEPSATPTGPSVTDEIEVVLAVTQAKSWLEVSVDGANVLSRTESAGFQQTYTGSQEITLVIGNAGAVTLTVNGVEQGTVGSSGQVLQLRCPVGATGCEVLPS